jgi:anti-sigma B factor antagonist
MGLPGDCQGGVVLSLKVRQVGEITIVRCAGRIVAGNETDNLREQIRGPFAERRNIVLHLGEVAFVDSSGLGMLVRLLTSARRDGGDLRLCNVPQHLHGVLKMTNLNRLFTTHECEEEAVSSFYKQRPAPESLQERGAKVMCVDRAADVLACLRAILVSAGYDVLTNNNLHDSLILIRATRPDLIILGPSLSGGPGTEQAFRTSCAAFPVVELGNDFSTRDAGHAGSELLQAVRRHLDARGTAMA